MKDKDGARNWYWAKDNIGAEYANHLSNYIKHWPAHEFP